MKQHTIIVVPHARAKFRKLRVTTLQASLVIGALALLTVGGLAASLSYFTNAVDREELRRIESENESLRQVNLTFEGSIRELQTQLDDYQQRIHKLAIVAGLAELSPSIEAGIGGMEPIDSPRAIDGLSQGDDREALLSGGLETLRSRADDLESGMSALHRKLEERRLVISSTPAIMPVRGLMTSGFGYRSDPFTKRRAHHNGLDIVAPPHKEVRATGSGIITRSERNRTLGNAVFISHGYGIETRYGHLSKLLVKAGQRVERGDVIGLLGNTGRATGYHLHYEVRLDGRPANPLGYILDAR